MKVSIAKTAGFCMGVRRAVDMALAASRNKNRKPVYTYGPLIHNPQVLELLDKKEISILENIPETGTGTVLIRAHGVPPSDKKKIKKAGFDLIDATCPRVARVQTIIAEHNKLGYTSIIFGDAEHPEVKGLIGCAGKEIYVIGGLSELNLLPLFKKAVIVAQTTQDLYQFQKAVKIAGKNFPDYKIFNTICNSTRKRQEEIKRLTNSVDAAVVIGSYNSGNTCRLVEIAAQTGKPSFHIETETDINFSLLAQFNHIGITAGASTPDWVIKNVCKTIGRMQTKRARIKEIGESEEAYNSLDYEELPPPPIEMPIEDVLDLHHFDPKEINSLLEDYLSECIKKRIYSVRLIHGKGKGILKKRTLSFLDKSSMVLSYSPAPIDAGGWGATIVELIDSDFLK